MSEPNLLSDARAQDLSRLADDLGRVEMALLDAEARLPALRREVGRIREGLSGRAAGKSGNPNDKERLSGPPSEPVPEPLPDGSP